MTRDPVAEAAARIDQLLPQTQCTRCGYPGCLPYATAMARGEANINRCPPGGQATIQALADLLGREPLPLDPAHGHEAPPRLAWIDEERCIGCARCLPPCPVDAILGAAKSLHTVLPDRCVGCELCVPACPVDCIEMRDAEVPAAKTAAVNRLRYQAHLARHARRVGERQQAIDAKKAAALNAVQGPPADRT